MNKQPQVTEQTRYNLSMAFWELYQEKPIEKITVREITDRAGYNRATFYLYYHDVYDLLGQIEDAILANVRTLVDEGLLREEELDVSHYMGVIVALVQRYDGYLPVLMGPHGDPSFVSRFKDILNPVLDRFILPAEGIDEQQRRILRGYYLSGLLAAINTWLAEPERMPTDQFVGLVAAAMLPPGGSAHVRDAG